MVCLDYGVRLALKPDCLLSRPVLFVCVTSLQGSEDKNMAQALRNTENCTIFQLIEQIWCYHWLYERVFSSVNLIPESSGVIGIVIEVLIPVIVESSNLIEP